MAGDDVDWVVVGDHSKQRRQLPGHVQRDPVTVERDVLHAVERREHRRLDRRFEAQLHRLR